MSDILNEALLEELRLVMEDEFHSLMETFLSESARQFAEAQQAWATSDMDQLRRSAHTLKGSCGNVGAEQLQHTCASLEACAKDGDAQDIPQLLDTVAAQLEDVSGAIQAL